jgi:chromate transporter
VNDAEGVEPSRGTPGEVFGAALRLGLTSFGGPIAHIGYFHREYVERRRWVAEATYLDLVGLCHLLPGATSSQVGIGIGLLRAGWIGALAAWVGFTLPSALALVTIALLTSGIDLAGAGWAHGLKLAAVAIVATAVLSMWRSLAPDLPRRAVALLAAAIILATGAGMVQVAVIVAGGALGWRLLSRPGVEVPDDAPSPIGRRSGLVALAVFVVLLLGLPLAELLTRQEWVGVVDGFYRAGALVLGGGHVVLPLLDESVVRPGWVSNETFLAGYGAAQAMPGPLFTVAGFIGASLEVAPSGVGGAAVALGAIFLPSFLLVVAAFPYWDRLRRSSSFHGVMAGANAAVIGLLIAALYWPLWTSSVSSAVDVALIGGAFLALAWRQAPPWVVVGVLAVLGQLMQALSVA